MAQPTPYTREFNFSNQQAATPSTPLPAPHLDAELNRVKLTTDQILANLALIQNDSGDLIGSALADGSVGFVQLAPDVVTNINTDGGTPEAFAAALENALPDSDEFNDAIAALEATDALKVDTTDLTGAAAATAGIDSYLGLKSGAFVKGKLSWFNASDYGTAGTTAALVAAIAACALAGGGIVFVPAGTWSVTTKITIPSQVKIVGAGIDVTKFEAANGLNDHMFTTTDTETLWAGTTELGAQYWGISDCTIYGNKANQTSGCGIKTYSRAFVIQRVKIEYCKEQGILTRWGDGPAYDDDDEPRFDLFMEALIDNVFVQYCDKEGVYYDGPHDGRMLNCIVALNSHTVAGSYDGVYIGPKAGGFMATMCHSWGENQRYAWNIEAQSTHFANCEADAAYTALVRINQADCTWIGGTQIGGFIFTPPSTANKNLKGFVFGASAYYPYIVCAVRNTPKGVVDFANVGNLGGVVQINGAIDAAIQTAATGETTFGFQGSIPSSFRVNIYNAGVGSNAIANQMPGPEQFVAGSAAFPALVGMADITTGMFFASNTVGFSVAGEEAFEARRNGVLKLIPRASDPSITAQEGMLYANYTTHKLMYYDGTTWQACF